MGAKGARGKATSKEATDSLLSALEPLGDISSRSMFGGHGVFCGDVMFGIVDPEGRLYPRADQTTVRAFEAAGSTQHARMPYWEVPEAVREDPERLRDWATTAAETAVRARR